MNLPYHPAAVALQALFDLATQTEREVARRLELNLTDYRALSALSHSGPVTVGKLAETLGATAATTTAIVSRLEAHGYAERLRSEEDRRHVHVSATPAATKDVMDLMRPLMASTNQHIEALPRMRQDAVSDFLSVAMHLMQDHLHYLSEKETP
ncbi:MarR family transcriptional regulator [Pseudarthrobacter sp. SL88]|uniref:MarR family winged helix-turn-helix transcriptional regulator n=1 Tax=Pseudarthrobacter sp. SL88 TaxID=2994666 RepID=UPI0022765679|nr:MarR family transcriptional regulator [Pseudarthrobacter sp. SL88]MCY1675665.1 MarR family transcriptional regulator [Pseudarthrobacter sp. SL88]